MTNRDDQIISGFPHDDIRLHPLSRAFGGGFPIPRRVIRTVATCVLAVLGDFPWKKTEAESLSLSYELWDLQFVM